MLRDRLLSLAMILIVSSSAMIGASSQAMICIFGVVACPLNFAVAYIYYSGNMPNARTAQRRAEIKNNTLAANTEFTQIDMRTVLENRVANGTMSRFDANKISDELGSSTTPREIDTSLNEEGMKASLQRQGLSELTAGFIVQVGQSPELIVK